MSPWRKHRRVGWGRKDWPWLVCYVTLVVVICVVVVMK